MLSLIHQFLKDDCGGSSVQTAVIATFISIPILAFVNGLGPKPDTTFSTLSTRLLMNDLRRQE